MEVSLVHRLTRGLLALVTVSLLVLSSPRAQADEQQDARTLFERGVEASRAERWQEARILFERSLSLVMKPSTLLNLAISCIKLGRGGEAIERLDAFAKVATPDEYGPMIERARVLRAQAQALIDNEQATARNGGQALSEDRDRSEEGLGEAARRQVTHAREAFARGDDREALAAFERAYEESSRAELLYNIGVVADRLRDDERAVRAYDQFAAALPDAPETAVAQVRSAALREALEERRRTAQKRAEAARAQQRAAARAVPASPPSPHLWPPRAVLISGGAIGGLAVGALGWYMNRNDRLQDCESPGQNRVCITDVDILRHERKQLFIATVALSGAAVATLTAGTVWLLLRRREGTQPPSLALTPQVELGSEGRYGFALSGRF